MSISPLLALILLIAEIAGAAWLMWYVLSGRARDAAAPARARLWLKIWQWKQHREQRRLQKQVDTVNRALRETSQDQHNQE